MEGGKEREVRVKGKEGGKEGERKEGREGGGEGGKISYSDGR